LSPPNFLGTDGV